MNPFGVEPKGLKIIKDYLLVAIGNSKNHSYRQCSELAEIEILPVNE